MASADYIFKLSNGHTLGTVYPLEGNGPGAQSVPRQIVDIDFSGSTPSILVADDVTQQFAPSTVVVLPIIAVTTGVVGVSTCTITIAGNYAGNDDLQPGNICLILSNPASGIHTIKSSVNSGGNTVITLTTVEPGITVTGTLTTIKQFTIDGGAYNGIRTMDPIGATYTGTHTSIPLYAGTMLPTPYFPMIAASAGLHGSIIFVGSANSACGFPIGGSFTLSDNSQPAANGTYTVQTLTNSGSDPIIGVNIPAKTITISGNRAVVYPHNQVMRVISNTANGQYTVASAVNSGANTVITTVEPLSPATTVSGKAMMYPPVTYLTVNETIPIGVGNDGTITAPPTVGYGAMATAPVVTLSSPNNYNIVWRVAGDQVSKFTVGCPVLVKGNNFFAYNELPIQSVSYLVGPDLTEITTHLVYSSAPVIDNSGELFYPVPIPSYGYMYYDVVTPFTSLELIGKGSPAFNTTTTWGESLQHNNIKMVENFATGIRTTVNSVISGANSKIFLPGIYYTNNALVLGHTYHYINDSGVANQTLTLTSNDLIGDFTRLTFAENIAGTVVGDGILVASGVSPVAPLTGQFWYDIGTPQLYLHTAPTTLQGVLVGGIPSVNPIDMGGFQINNLGNPTLAMDAVNQQTADLLYISKSGGFSNTAANRSGTMTGSFNVGALPAGKPDVLGVNLSSVPTRLYGTADIEFDVAGSGTVHIAGTGNVLVDKGNVTVGTGTNKLVIQNNVGVAPTITFTTSMTGQNALNLGSNKITNVSTPTLPADGANKAYVDGLANGIVWLQPVLEPNLFSDTLSTPPFVTTNVVSATTGVSNAWKINGNYASQFTVGQTLTITDNTFPAANKSYVVISAANNAGNTDVTVTASTIPVGVANNGTATDTSVVMHKAYLVKSTATGAWVGLEDHIVTYGVTNIDPSTQAQTWGWIDVLGRSVQIGDRFGVFVDPDPEDPLTLMPSGGLLGSAGKIATITGTGPYTYSFYTPTEPYAFSVTGVSPTIAGTNVSSLSPHFGHSYTFRGTWGTGTYGSTYKWIEFSGPTMLVAGGGLKYNGSILNVGSGAGITVNPDSIQINTTYVDTIYLRVDGTVPMTGILDLNSHKIVNVTSPTLGSDAANKTYTDTQDALRVSKSGDSIAGTLTFTSGTATGLPVPSVNSDAANKVYVDNSIATRVNKAGDTITGTLILSGGGVTITLPNAPVLGTDAVNKTYADTKLGTSGGTLTGPLVLAADPVVALGAATKQYVDTGFVSKTISTALTSNVNITFAGTGEVLGLPASPTTGGSATSKTYVDAQLALKTTDTLAVHLAGIETITGAKTFTAAGVFNNTLTVAANGTNTNLLINSTTITLTGTPVASGGAAGITATAGINAGGAGGDVAIAGGNGSTNGGNITLTGGQGSAGTGGNITLTTGTGTSANGQFNITAGSGSLSILASGVVSVGGAVPSAKSQALCSDTTNPTTAKQTWQLVGTRTAAAPGNSASAGYAGNWFADDSFFYVYGATGWRRVAVAAF